MCWVEGAAAGRGVFKAVECMALRIEYGRVWRLTQEVVPLNRLCGDETGAYIHTMQLETPSGEGYGITQMRGLCIASTPRTM